MEIRKFWMISLCLLFILMLGCVSASEDLDDVVSYNQSDDQIIQSNDFNEDLSQQSDADGHDDAVGEEEDDVLSTDDSNANVGAGDEDDVLGATLTYNDLFYKIYSNGESKPIEFTLSNDYVYNPDKDNMIWHGGINIKKKVIIHGNGHYIDGRNIFGHFTLTTVSESSGELIIDNLNLVNGKEVNDETRGGSIIVSSGTKLTATNCRFEGCTAKSGGAVLMGTNTDVTFTNCKFYNNRATSTSSVNIAGGGAIYGSANSLTITNCEFTGNYAPVMAGAVGVVASQVTIKGSTFSSNRVDSEGSFSGAVFVKDSNTVTVENCNFGNNNAMNGEGAGICIINSRTFNIINSNFIDSFASYNAGAVAIAECSNVNIQGSVFRNSVVTEGKGGAIRVVNSANFNIRDSIFENNTAFNGGGAIDAHESKLAVYNSNFTNNNVINGTGGAISSLNVTLSIVNSNFNYNTAGNSGGGAICSIERSLTVEGSTFNHNAASTIGGAICAIESPLTVLSSSFDHNNAASNTAGGGAIYGSTAATFNVKDSIFTNNDATGNESKGGAINAYKITDMTINNSTLEKNSAKIGSALFVEQVNVNIERSILNNNTADFFATIYSVNSTLSISDSNITNNYAMAGTVAFAGNLRFTVNNVNFIKNYGGNQAGAIYLHDDSILTVTDSLFEENEAVNGGAILSMGGATITISNSEFKDNLATYGGAIDADSSSLSVTGSNFTGNTAALGAAIFVNNQSTLILVNSNINDNLANRFGAGFGAIYVYNSNVNVKGSNFNNNVALNQSGAVHLFGSSMAAENSTFDNNKAGCGGAIRAYGCYLVLDDSTFRNNKADSDGGAINITVSYCCNITNSRFEGNTAELKGGAVCSETVLDFNIIGSTFSNNQGITFGGAVYAKEAMLNIADSNFNDNSILGGGYGGAVYFQAPGTITVSGSNFRNNYARYGGAISGVGKTVVSNSAFNDNEANYQGGAVYVYKGAQSIMSYSNFTNNKANYDNGGAIYSYDATLNADNLVFNHNTGKSDSGVYANNGLISNSIFMETNVVGGISESGNQHFTPAAFTIDNIADIIQGNSITVIITESHGFTGTLNVAIGSNTYSIDMNNGAGSRTISGLSVGTYKVILDFPQTGEYYSAHVEGNEFHVRYSSEFSIATISNVVQGQSILLDVTESHGYTGDVTVVIGSKSFVVSMDNGKGKKSVSDLDAGSHKAVIDFQQTDKYTSAHAESNQFNVMYSTSFTIAAISDAVLGESVLIDVTEANGYSGNVNVAIGSKSYTVSLSNGKGTKSVSDLGVGTHKAVIDFTQSGNYDSAHAESNQFNVRYSTSFAIATIPDAVLGESVLIDVTEANGYSGNVNVAIGSKSYTVSLSNGKGTKSVSDLGVGTHKAVIDFSQSGDYASAHAESNQFAVRYNTSFTIAAISDAVLGDSVDVDVTEANGYDGVVTLVLGSSVLLNVTEANGYTGDVTVVIGSKSYTVSLSNGKGTKSINDLDVGTHKAVIDFAQSGDYASAYAEGNQFNVRYSTSFAIADIPDAVLGESVLLNVTEANGYTGDVTVVIGSKSYTVSMANGEGTRTVNDLIIGTYKAVIDFAQSGDYASAQAESNQFAVRYQPEFAISQIQDSLYGDPIQFTITEAHALNATVRVTVGLFEDSVELTNGEGSVYIASIDAGTYTPLLNFTGSDLFVPATATGNEFVVKYASFVDLNDVISASSTVELDRDYAFDETYDMQFANGIPITNDVVINGNGHVIDAKGLARIFDISNGAKVTFENVTLANGNAENGGAIQASADSDVTVINSSFDNNTASGEGSAIYSEGVLNVSGSSFANNPAANGSGIHADNGEIDNSSIIGGGVSGNIPVSDDCVIMSNPLFVIANIPDFVSGTSVTISVSESHNLTGKVEVSIGDEKYVVDVVNGLGTKTVSPKLTFGTYTANLKFNATADFVAATAQSNPFHVSVNPEIQFANIADVLKGNAFEIKLTANSLFNGKVKVTIGGVMYDVNMVGGAGSIAMPQNMTPGEYNASATYSGDENFTAAKVDSNSFKICYSTEITSKAVTAVYNDGQYLYVTLKDSDGNAVIGVKVKVEIPKAKTATPVTDNNGQVKIPLTGIAPNTYNAKITFAGEACYAGSTKSVSVIVKKATPKLTASKKTFKKSVKVKKYTITLKDNKGKAMNKAKVTVKIKNKSFSATVGKNGKATFKITKFNKKGKFTATVTFKGNAYYNKVSKSAKITIK